MGWVTLTCRTKEDKMSASYYELELLRCSREQRQMARYYQSLGTQIQNEQRVETEKQREYYDGQIDVLQDKISFAQSVSTVLSKKQSNDEGKTDYEFTDEEEALLEAVENDTAFAGMNYDQLQAEIKNYDQQVYDLRDEKQEKIDELKTFYEDELAMNEQMSSDEELIMQQEQTDLETMKEAVTNELNAIKDSASQEIQSSVIRLS